MINVILYHEKPLSVMQIVAELRDHGCIQKKDFDFAYYPATFNDKEATPRHTVFSFHDENLASWFALKYCT